jgi:hypothetical protein
MSFKKNFLIIQSNHFILNRKQNVFNVKIRFFSGKIFNSPFTKFIRSRSTLSTPDLILVVLYIPVYYIYIYILFSYITYIEYLFKLKLTLVM